MRNSPEVGGDGWHSGSEGGHGQAEEEEEGEPTEASETQGPLWKRLSQNKAGGRYGHLPTTQSKIQV